MCAQIRNGWAQLPCNLSACNLLSCCVTMCRTRGQCRPVLCPCAAVLIPFFQQFTGINTIMFYASQLFVVLGAGQNSALLNTAIIGAVNVGSTLAAIILVDR